MNNTLHNKIKDILIEHLTCWNNSSIESIISLIEAEKSALRESLAQEIEAQCEKFRSYRFVDNIEGMEESAKIVRGKDE